MISTHQYPEKNLLRVHFKDSVTTTQFDTFLRELPGLLEGMPEGFVLISDFSDLNEMDFACWKPVGNMMEQMVQAGVGEVIRVMEDPAKDIGCGILSSFHYPKTLPIKIFNNLSEVLDRYQLTPPDDLAAI